MKLNIPSLADVLGLFFKPTTVAGALADLHRAADRAKAVIEHNRAKAKVAQQRHNDLITRALKEAEASDSYDAEADRAGRVAERLAELLA